MTHARQQIREAVATILSRNPVAWRIAFQSRRDSLQQDIWPYLLVFSEGESSQPTSVSNPCVYGRELTLTVAGMVKVPIAGGPQAIEDKMEAIAAEIETKLTQSALRGAVPQVQSLSLVSTNLQMNEEEDGADHAEVITSWRIGYSTLEGSPEVLI